MQLPVKPSGLQSYQLVLYRRALHPELFSLKGRRLIRNGVCEFEAWIMPGAHVLRFNHGRFVASELVTDQESGLPTEGAVTTFLCAGERDFEHSFEDSGVRYLTTVQTETLSENLYNATYQEMVEFSEETEALTHEWDDPERGRCLSVLDVQRYGKEVHAQSFHLWSAGGLVLRTQTMFEHS